MTRSLKEIKVDFDSTTDVFVREQFLTEAREASARVQRKIKRVLITVGIVWLLVVIFMTLNFVFPVNTEINFLTTLIGISGALGFALAVTWTVRNFQRERYAAAITAFEGRLAQAETGSESH